MTTGIEREILQKLEETEGFVRLVNKEDLPSTWGSRSELLKVDLGWFTDKGIDFIFEKTKINAVRNKINQLRKFKANPDEKVKTLKNIPTIVRARYEKDKYKWLFEQTEDGTTVAWFVVKAEYEPPRPKYDTPASASISLSAHGFNSVKSKNVKWHTEDVTAKSFSDLLSDAGLIEATDEMMEEYNETLAEWKSVYRDTGTQMTAKGNGKLFYYQKRSHHSDEESGYLQTKWTSCVVDGRPIKFVVDAETEEIEFEKDKVIRKDFWSRASSEDDEIEEAIPVPRHPEVFGFSLHHHSWMQVHVKNLTAYPWNDKIEDSLVLQKEDKKLIRILIESTGKKMSDIVSGKSGGVIVLASGYPGVGKTLTAEVTSELLEKVLYNVQCSQLGVDLDQIERNLNKVLNRASRWGAILLIDEADVYVRTRGKDIVQNAIVGIFLRLLEYYNGFLFMTTNRAITVDDAILSRCTAHVRYDLPNTDALRRIAQIQVDVLEAEIGPGCIDHLIATYKTLSGRDIRSIFKMAKLVCEANEEAITPDDIDFCVKYQDIASGQEE